MQAKRGILLLFVGALMFLLIGGSNIYRADATPELKQPSELSPEVAEEYYRLLKNRNDAMQELIELYELRILELQGKLHSS